jgi:tetratricopeptide (TPR) repeat protein
MLFDQGNAGVLDRALRSLDETNIAGSAAALFLCGQLERLHGRPEEAMRRFRAALETTGDSPDLRVRTSLALAAHLGNVRQHEEALEVLDKISSLCTGNADLDGLVDLQRCISRVVSGRVAVDPVDVARFRDRLSECEDATTRARLLYGLAQLMENSGAFEQARSYSLELLRMTDEKRLYNMANLAAISLFRAAFALGDNAEALAWTFRWAHFAQRVGNNEMQTWLLMARLWMYAEAGDAAAAHETELRLHELEMLNLSVATTDYAPAHLFGLAASGKFEESAQWLSGWLERAPLNPIGMPEVDRFYRSQFAFYFAAGGEEKRARVFLSEASNESLESVAIRYRRPRYDAFVWAALTYVVLGEFERAREQLETIDRAGSEVLPRTRLISCAVGDIYRSARAGPCGNIEGRCADLRANGLGGYALIFESLCPQLAAAFTSAGT